MVLSRIGPQFCPQLDESQGGFKWGLPTPSLPSLIFRTTRHGWKACWFVCVMLVSPVAWRLLTHFLRGTQSQIRSGASLSAPWTDTGIAQGRVLSPLLFNLLVNGLATSMRQAAQRVQFGVSHRFTNQRYADD